MSELKRYSPVAAGICEETDHGCYALHAEAMDAISRARREERERIAQYIESMDIPHDEHPYSPAAIAEDIRNSLQQIDTNVKQPSQTAPSEHQVSTFHDTGQTHSEPMQAGKNVNGATGEKEPKPCPFCHAEMEFTPDELRPDGVWEHPRGNCILQGTRITGDNVPDWNRRAPSWREEGNEQS